ncbi:heme NO-binding domain-containing protein [Rhodobacter calidifons]|uniref:Heme NO-binding protein n=1 Tax=Rhodobacter calidifons TaxID=2715277 RepID=A0ABX0GCM1_9RHOB|nr:heme NO-binding domain-containing protein [Rhodobacter calidifons]NHB78492.1 heme NO-binding protein [Rhodobacter calidifons]
MDALLLRSVQNYVLDTFGQARWHEICAAAGQPVQTFEPMLRYPSGLADRIADIAAEVLGRPVEAIWEDIGTYLVTNPDREGVRRLLRFGGVSFSDFLHSLEELPGRARLALPDLDPPEILLTEVGPDRYELRCRSPLKGMQRVLTGMLTAMADDYGALCLIEPGAEDCILITVLDSRYAEARAFELARPDP